MEPTSIPHIGYKLKAQYRHLAPEMVGRKAKYALSSIFLPDTEPTKEAAEDAITAADEIDREYPGAVNYQMPQM